MGFRPPEWLVVPEQLERLFPVICAHHRLVPAEQRGQAFFLIWVEIPRILQQQPAAALEPDPLLQTQAADLTAPDFFDGFVEVLDDMKPVEQDLCTREL